MTHEEKTSNEATPDGTINSDARLDNDARRDSALEDSLRSVRALGENRAGNTGDED